MNALRFPAYRIYFVAFFLSNIGTWMHNFAQTWLMYRQTHGDPLYLGYLALAFAGPMVVVTPFGGVLADRFPRGRVLLMTQSLSAAVALGVSVLATREQASPPLLLVAQTLLALLLAVDNPTRQSAIGDLVPKESLPSALALNSAIFTGAALVGPMLGGLLLSSVGPGGLFRINAASFMLPILALVYLRARLNAARAVRRAAFLSGLQHIWRTAPLRRLFALGYVLPIFGRSYVQLLPIFADGRFHRGAKGYSGLLTAAGLGALLGALVLTLLSRVKDRRRTVFIATLSASLTLAGFAFAHTYALAWAMVLCTAAAAGVASTSIGTIVQTEVPPELRGRVVAFHVISVVGIPFFGAWLLSHAARATEPTRAVLAFAVVSGLSACVWRWRDRN
jgi:MFS family permease